MQQAIIIAKQIVVQPKPVVLTENSREMLQADLNNETETIRNYRQGIRQRESTGEYATAELIRGILIQEQDHQMALATALGVEAPKSDSPKAEAAANP